MTIPNANLKQVMIIVNFWGKNKQKFCLTIPNLRIPSSILQQTKTEIYFRLNFLRNLP